MNILITSASRKVGLINAFKRALKKFGNGKVVAVDINADSAALYSADISHIVPKSDSEDFLKVIEEICISNSIGLIIPTRDEELITFSKNIAHFKKIGIEIMVSDFEAINLCLDKYSFIRFCNENNFNTPKTYNIEEARHNPSIYPLFIKERFGKSSKNVFKIDNYKEIECILNFIKEPIIQQYIYNPEYTIDLFADFQGNVISVVPRERIITFGGESIVGRTVKNKTLQDETTRLANSLGLVGHNTIQCFFDGVDVKFIEVNPRFGGGATISILAGADTPFYLIRLLNGEKIEKSLNNFIDGFKVMRYIEDIIVPDEASKGVKRID